MLQKREEVMVIVEQISEELEDGSEIECHSGYGGELEDKLVTNRMKNHNLEFLKLGFD